MKPAPPVITTCPFEPSPLPLRAWPFPLYGFADCLKNFLFFASLPFTGLRSDFEFAGFIQSNHGLRVRRLPVQRDLRLVVRRASQPIPPVRPPTSFAVRSREFPWPG